MVRPAAALALVALVTALGACEDRTANGRIGLLGDDPRGTGVAGAPVACTQVDFRGRPTLTSRSRCDDQDRRVIRKGR